MAKKVVATLKTGTGKNFTKVIKMVKSDKTGAYAFKSDIVPNDQIKEFEGNFCVVPPGQEHGTKSAA